MFSDMLGDIVSIQKTDGRLIEKVKASVQQNKIFILDVNLPIEENDKIYRKLPNGLSKSTWYWIGDLSMIRLEVQ